MIKYNIIQDTKYFTLAEARKEIQNILNGNKQVIPDCKLIDSINKGLNSKKNNLAQLCWYSSLLDAIKENDDTLIKRYCKFLKFNY